MKNIYLIALITLGLHNIKAQKVNIEILDSPAINSTFLQVQPTIEIVEWTDTLLVIKEVNPFQGEHDNALWHIDVEGTPTWVRKESTLSFHSFCKTMTVWTEYYLKGLIVMESQRHPFAKFCEESEVTPNLDSIFITKIDSLKTELLICNQDLHTLENKEPEVIVETVYLPSDTIKIIETEVLEVIREKDICLEWEWDFGDGFKPFFSLYPNPVATNQEVKLKMFGGADYFNLKIKNALGVEVLEDLDNNQEKRFSLSDSGFYLLEITIFGLNGKNILLSKKLVVGDK